jgi:hypothetical protein
MSRDSLVAGRGTIDWTSSISAGMSITSCFSVTMS